MKTVIKMYLIKVYNLFKTLITGLIKFFNNFIKITNLADSHIPRTENTHKHAHTQHQNYHKVTEFIVTFIFKLIRKVAHV